MKSNFRNFNGFTLIEMLVVIAIFTLIMTIATKLIRDFYVTNAYAIEQSAAIENAREGVGTMVRDLREAVPSQGGAYPIENLGIDTIIFYSDIDRDEAVEKARYYVDASRRLIKDTYEAPNVPTDFYPLTPTATNIVAEHIMNGQPGFPAEIFQYFDENGLEITDLNDVDEVRFVEVNLVVNVDPNRAPEEYVLRSSAYLRNLKPTLQ
jgi:prepilin-type N-terminal cleavage/methylation domain-containing protein